MFTILFVDKHKNAVPISRFIDLYGLLKNINQLAKKTEKRRFKMFSKIGSLNFIYLNNIIHRQALSE
jgi:uncharacterized radical SAM superfamily Fe-S cluster-containing enzyme